MLSKAFVVAVVLPMLVLIALGFGLSSGMRRLYVVASQHRSAWEQPVSADATSEQMPLTAGPTGSAEQRGSARRRGQHPQAVAFGSAPVASAPTSFSSRGRRLYDPTGRRWRPRGGELMQTNSCGELSPRPDLTELLERADRLLQSGVNLVHIPLEPWQDAGSWSHPDDVAELQALVMHVVKAPHVAVMLSAATPMGTSAGADDLPRQLAFWREVVEVFAQQPQVIFDLSLSQLGGDMQADDATVAFNTNALLQEIRATERAFGAPMHLVAVQGMSPDRNSRGRDYYQGGLLPAAKAGNVVWVGQRPSYLRHRAGGLFVSPLRYR